MRFGKHYFALGDDTVHMKNVTGNELLKQKKRLQVADLVQPGPQLGGLLDFFHTDPGCLRTRFQQPRRFHARHETFQIFVIQNVHEFRHQNPGFSRTAAHRQLVAKIAHGGESHARNTQMFA